MTEADRAEADESATDRLTARFPAADISAAQFEDFVTKLFESAAPLVENLRITPHEKIEAPDGTYDFDATIRYELGGMSFLVLVEAKHHRNSIKRELVQILHEKLQSTGAHKAVMVSTAPYQRGAVAFAKVHGIALATVTEGRFTYETRGRRPGQLAQEQPLSREEAAQRYGAPTFVAHSYAPGAEPGSTRVTLLSPDDPEYVAEELLDVPASRPR